MITWSDFSTIFRALLRWWWVVLVAVALATGSAWYIGRQNEERFYFAKATLIVGTSFESTAPDANSMGISNGLTHFYAELAQRQPVLQPVQEQLHLPFSWEYLSKNMLAATIVSNANLLEIQITDSNPERAALIANTIGEQLISSSPASPEKIKAQQDVIDQQITDSDTKINQLRAKISELTALRIKATSASDATEINGQLTQFSASLTEEEAVYRSLLSLKNGATINSLSFVERATPAVQPLPSKRIVAIGVAGVVGLLLALLAVWVLEYFDPRWRGAADVQHRFKLRHLSAVPVGAPLLTAAGDAAPRREAALRAAHTHMLLAAGEGHTRSIVVSSVKPSEQRTAVALDLACLFARSGHQVLLVGTDACSARLNDVLLVTPKETGTSLVPGSSFANMAFGLRAQIVPTTEPNLALLPVALNSDGTPHFAPTLRVPELASHLSTQAEVVIFDGPAALDGATAALLASTVDGAVLVLAPTDTRAEVFESRDRLLNQPSARIFGAITLQPASRKRKAAQAAPWTRPQIVQPLLSAEHTGDTASTTPVMPPAATESTLSTPLAEAAETAEARLAEASPTGQPATPAKRSTPQRRVKRGRGGHVVKPEIVEQAA